MSFQKVADALNELQAKVAGVEIDNGKLVDDNNRLRYEITLLQNAKHDLLMLNAQLRKECTMCQDE